MPKKKGKHGDSELAALNESKIAIQCIVLKCVNKQCQNPGWLITLGLNDLNLFTITWTMPMFAMTWKEVANVCT